MLNLALNLSKTCQKYFNFSDSADSPVAPPDRQASIAGRLPSGKFDRRARSRQDIMRARQIHPTTIGQCRSGILRDAIGGIASACRDAVSIDPRLARAIVRAA
jgi:hypothetical protein